MQALSQQQLARANAPAARSRRSRRTAPLAAKASAEHDAVSAPVKFAQKVAGVAAAAAIALQATVALPADAAPQALFDLAGLGQNPIKSAPALLRYALPIKNKPIREVQKSLEEISEDLRVPGVKFSGVEKNVKRSLDIVKRDAKAILADVAPSKKAGATATLAALQKGLEEFVVIVDNRDKQEVPIKQQQLLALVGQIEEDMVDGFPFTVPKEYAALPQLLGRAEVEMTFRLKEGLSSNPNIKEASMRIVLDGYNAPISAGNFVDLIERKFYDGMAVQRSDGFVVQSGDPDGPADGFIDPATGKIRTVPLEIMVKGDKVPQYGETMEDSGRYKEDPALPFNAFGTLAMARGEFDNNNASSQFFFLLKESELTPSGTNILDGRYAVFGYVVEGQEVLRDVKVNDVIKSIKVLSGAENLVNGGAKSAPAPAAAAEAEPIAA